MESERLSDKARMIVVKDMSNSSIAGLLQSILEHDKITYEHCINVAFLTAEVMVDKKVDKKVAKQVVQGALLHDIGKLDIPTNILKKSQQLKEEEYSLIKKHPEYGVMFVLNRYPSVLTPIIKDIILHHHEIEGGGGYPDGIVKMDKYTSLISVIDKYEAMTAERGYGERYSSEYALASLQRQNFDLDAIYAIKNCEVI